MTCGYVVDVYVSALSDEACSEGHMGSLDAV